MTDNGITMQVKPDELNFPSNSGWVTRLDIMINSSVPTTLNLKVAGLPEGVWTHFLPEVIRISEKATVHLVLVGTKAIPLDIITNTLQITAESENPIDKITVFVPTVKLPPPSPPAVGMLFVGTKGEVSVEKESKHMIKGSMQYMMVDKQPITVTPKVQLFSMEHWSAEPLPEWLTVMIKRVSSKLYSNTDQIAKGKFLLQFGANKDALVGDYLLRITLDGPQKVGATELNYGETFLLLHINS